MASLILAVNVGQREALTSDDRVVPIIELHGSDGLTNNPAEAVCAIACGGPTEWFAINLAEYDARPN